MDERTPKEDLLVEGLDDWAYASWVANSIPASAAESGGVLRHACVGLIAEVLAEGLMLPGQVDRAGHHVWEISIGEAIVKIAREWAEGWPDDLPAPGDIVWLANTPAGDQIARSVLAREKRQDGDK